ncbi:Tol-Pal system beta propeller repeat protein TolB [Pontivivens insulae]|uniref:Tol-Pal system protein TolB n=1 Tax=Pontivivens insulae TaxID=1639689 RepID=A0A2R8A8M8_9RHOB|nr:Tol-Pal system beta propeller repeat protein TolB [Pontivivens insulae]RED18685.1 TolB protein [Pontivivens insulae]SPF28583.1 Dipeptidyl-peptidase 5 [Pontivivens insulae]
MSIRNLFGALCALLVLALPGGLFAQTGEPLRATIGRGVFEPIPMAIPQFTARDAAAEQFSGQVAEVITANLTGTGLFRAISPDAFITPRPNFDVTPTFTDWTVINAQGLVTGATSIGADGRLTVAVQLWDTFNNTQIGDGVTFTTDQANWRRAAHKASDVIYTRLTGESAYFDSEIVFVAETGPKNARVKRIAIMDQDGANVRYLTDGSDLVLAPRFAPNGTAILYTSYRTGFPQVYLQDLVTGARQTLGNTEGMSFAPRFSPDGRRVVLSQTSGANTDIFTIDLATGARTRLTRSPAIDTAPSFSPDGSQIVFESDRGGSQQLYVMPANGGTARRISFGNGTYGTPVWSPRGDRIAFTASISGRFHVGVMNTDGSREQLLTASFLDEGPTWSPNGRVLMFFRETPGPLGAAALVSVDVTGQNLRYVPTPAGGSDPNWSPLRAN